MTIDIRGSLFCEVRETSVEPLCGFYASAIAARAAALRRLRGGARQRVPRLGGAVAAASCRSPWSGARDRQRGGRRMIAALLCLRSGWPAEAGAARRSRRSRRRRRPRRAAAILVVPFETPGRDGRTYWLGEAVAVLMADDVNARGLGAITRPSRERAYDQLHLPPNAVLSRATVIKVGELVGAGAGDRRRSRASTATRSPSRRARSGSTSAAPTSEVTERGNARRSVRASCRKSARRLVPGGTEAPAGAGAVAPGVRAIRQGAAGRTAGEPGVVSRGRAQARSRRTIARGWRSGRCGRRRGITPRRWPPRAAVGAALAGGAARALSRAGVSLHVAEATRRGVHACSRPCRTRPRTPAILNNLGVIQLRRGAGGRHGQAGVLLHQGGGSGARRSGHPVQSRLRLRARSRSAGGDLLAARGAPPQPGGRRRALRPRRRRSTRPAAPSKRARERELAAQLSTLPADAASARREPLPRGLERVRQHLESVARQRHRSARSPTPRSAISATSRSSTSSAARRLFEGEQDREAMMELRRAVFLSPYEAEAHLLIGRIHLRARPAARSGRRAEDLDLEPRHRRRPRRAGRRVSPAEGRPGREGRVQKALALDPDSAEAKALTGAESTAAGGRAVRG